MRNQTGIEDWIVDKAVHRRLVARAKGEPIEPFVFPYNLGLVQNVLQVMNKNVKGFDCFYLRFAKVLIFSLPPPFSDRFSIVI